ncbi:hypothetical protein NLG97_g9355 [Lecanicillium saksenae]|uniref:Uncharacterized protein n=1 Tax=Lecanicillium saksenae TaxID=468837 RepID=A0ACC1QHY6_9HYPO|nr:hypothetical protein NLG97_g9355 [Lecanicillium saksenae]
MYAHASRYQHNVSAPLRREVFTPYIGLGIGHIVPCLGVTELSLPVVQDGLASLISGVNAPITLQTTTSEVAFHTKYSSFSTNLEPYIMNAVGPTSPKCLKYAQFSSHLVRWQFKVIYWILFVTNLLLLFFGSFVYIKAQDALSKYTESPGKLRKRLRTCIIICTACVLVSTVIVVMEAYTLLALQFCDGEDLMSLYWSTWTMIQIGSLIALVGVILAMFHTLRNKTHPPWALALGTPVLVIAGLLHMCYYCTRSRCKKLRRKYTSDTDTEPPMSRVNTIRRSSSDSIDETIRGEFIGFTVEGGPIVRFTNSDNVNIPEGGVVLGSSDGSIVVSYRRDSVRFLNEDQDAGNEISKATSSNQTMPEKV